MLIHQLAREVWWYEAPFPVSLLGFAAEPQYLRPYRSVPVVTVSESTRKDLRKFGFGGPITVIPEGVEKIGSIKIAQPAEPAFLYVGRLAPSKRIEHMIEALASFRQITRNGSLWLVGSGPERYRDLLSKLARRLEVEENVVFCGRVTTDEKHQLMAQATSILMTSVREGWGLVVSEANACGTPAIVYDVPGLRDSVRHGVTGLLVPPQQTALVAAMIRLASDTDLRDRLGTAGRQWSDTLSFDDATCLMEKALAEAVA
jgi:glycosyltransferase involved in cell wall biosynthesis